MTGLDTAPYRSLAEPNESRLVKRDDTVVVA